MLKLPSFSGKNLNRKGEAEGRIVGSIVAVLMTIGALMSKQENGPKVEQQPIKPAAGAPTPKESPPSVTDPLEKYKEADFQKWLGEAGYPKTFWPAATQAFTNAKTSMREFDASNKRCYACHALAANVLQDNPLIADLRDQMLNPFLSSSDVKQASTWELPYAEQIIQKLDAREELTPLDENGIERMMWGQSTVSPSFHQSVDESLPLEPDEIAANAEMAMNLEDGSWPSHHDAFPSQRGPYVATAAASRALTRVLRSEQEFGYLDLAEVHNRQRRAHEYLGIQLAANNPSAEFGEANQLTPYERLVMSLARVEADPGTIDELTAAVHGISQYRTKNGTYPVASYNPEEADLDDYGVGVQEDTFATGLVANALLEVLPQLKQNPSTQSLAASLEADLQQTAKYLWSIQDPETKLWPIAISEEGKFDGGLDQAKVVDFLMHFPELFPPEPTQPEFVAIDLKQAEPDTSAHQKALNDVLAQDQGN